VAEACLHSYDFSLGNLTVLMMSCVYVGLA